MGDSQARTNKHDSLSLSLLLQLPLVINTSSSSSSSFSIPPPFATSQSRALRAPFELPLVFTIAAFAPILGLLERSDLNSVDSLIAPVVYMPLSRIRNHHFGEEQRCSLLRQDRKRERGEMILGTSQGYSQSQLRQQPICNRVCNPAAHLTARAHFVAHSLCSDGSCSACRGMLMWAL